MIDLIVLTGNWWTPIQRPTAFTNYSQLANGNFLLQVICDPQFTFQLQASTNLFDWVTLLTTNTAGTNFTFIDAEAATNKWRYYRMR